MIVIPAVDIRNGRCVRLLQGRMEAETVYSEDPAQAARRWEDEGAERLHVVDLDGAFQKSPRNLSSIRRILAGVRIPIQVGGGIRTMDVIETYFDAGIDRLVLGTEAIRNPELVREACRSFPGRILLGIDARNGKVAIEGWTRDTDQTAVELAGQFEGSGLAGINFTDIHRDGMQTGPNLEETKRLAQAVSVPVFASGGVSTLEDIRRLSELEPFGVAGVITGKALYAGALDLREAIRVGKGG